jgi:hypothetical protein
MLGALRTANGARFSVHPTKPTAREKSKNAKAHLCRNLFTSKAMCGSRIVCELTALNEKSVRKKGHVGI